MLYEFRDLNNWVFEKQTATTLQQKLYWFCAIRNVFHNTLYALRDHLDREILNFQPPKDFTIPYSDPLSKYSYFLAMDAILSWVNPKFNMQSIVAKRKHKNEMPRGIVLYDEEVNQQGEPYVYIYYLVACDKGQKMGLGLLRSVMLEFAPGTQFYLDVRKINHTAIHLYEKMNFTIETAPNMTPDFNLECSHLMGVKSTRELLLSLPLENNIAIESASAADPSVQINVI